MSLKNTAKETLDILEVGKYTNSTGKTVEFLAAQQSAVKKTVLYTPQQSYALLEQPAGTSDRPATLEVTAETTQAAAPNAGQALRRDPQCGAAIAAALERRAGIILAIARDNGHRSLLLGAWGCGVFCNDPRMVADVFGRWLADPRFLGCFDRVVFAIYTSKHNLDTLTAFQQRFLMTQSN